MTEIILSVIVGLAILAACYGVIFLFVSAPAKIVIPIFIAIVTFSIIIAAYFLGARILGYR